MFIRLYVIKSSSRSSKVILSLGSRLLGAKKSLVFEERARLFLAKNRGNINVSVEILGLNSLDNTRGSLEQPWTVKVFTSGLNGQFAGSIEVPIRYR